MLRLTVQEIQSTVGEKTRRLDLLAPWLKELMVQHSLRISEVQQTETAQIRNKTSNEPQGLPLAACFLQLASTASANRADSERATPETRGPGRVYTGTARLFQEHFLEGKKQLEVFTLGTKWEVAWVPCSVAVMGTIGLLHHLRSLGPSTNAQ